MIRRTAATLVLAVVLLLTAIPGGAAAQEQIPEKCRTIIGCADAGPKPENPGDRGGYAQLLTLVVLVGGVGFIATKVVRATRASQPSPGA